LDDRRQARQSRIPQDAERRLAVALGTFQLLAKLAQKEDGPITYRMSAAASRTVKFSQLAFGREQFAVFCSHWAGHECRSRRSRPSALAKKLD